jgi:hypothetical protein
MASAYVMAEGQLLFYGSERAGDAAPFEGKLFIFTL